MSLFRKKRDHGEVGTRNPGEGAHRRIPRWFRRRGVTLPRCFTQGPSYGPIWPPSSVLPPVNSSVQRKTDHCLSFRLHRSEGETVRSRGSLFCSYSHWNYEVSIAVGPISAEGLTKERRNFLMCLILFFETGSTHTETEKVTVAALPSAAQICPLLCCQWGRPYQDLVPQANFMICILWMAKKGNGTQRNSLILSEFSIWLVAGICSVFRKTASILIK